MRKYLYAICLVVTLVSTTYSQQYKRLRIGIGAGYGLTADKVKFTIAIEPSYRIHDNWTIGLKLETAFLQQDVYGNTIGAEIDYSSIGSYTLNCQYYLGEMRFRPFIGFGAGSCKVRSFSSVNRVNFTESFSVGFYPRLGFDFGHFNFVLDYNLILNSSSVVNGEELNKYLSIRLGLLLGGGKKIE